MYVDLFKIFFWVNMFTITIQDLNPSWCFVINIDNTLKT